MKESELKHTSCALHNKTKQNTHPYE